MKKRISKFELLRILAMYLIVLHHAIVHGILTISPVQQIVYPEATTLSIILGMGGKVGVFIFVLITGYFMINSKISFGKIIKLWLPIFFWSITLFITFSISNPINFSIKKLIKAVFPILFNQYWFMTVYFFMYCMIPILNTVVNSLDSCKRKVYFTILGLPIIVSQYGKFYGGNTGLIGSSLLTFCFVYCLGALFQKNDILKNNTLTKRINIIFILVVLSDILVITLLTFISAKFHIIIFLALAQSFAFNYGTLIPILLAVGLFLFVGSCKIGYHPIWNKIATVTFGIYLISDNNYTRDFIWKTMLSMNHMISKNILWILSYTIVVSLIVFVISGCLEYIRKIVFDRLENKLCNYANIMFTKVIK